MWCRSALVGCMSTTSNASRRALNIVWRSLAITMDNSAILSCQTMAVAVIKAKGALLIRQTIVGAAIAAHNVMLSCQMKAGAAGDLL